MSASAPFRALVVDDDAFVRLVTVRALRQGGFSCEDASNGKEALEKLRDSHIDVVICDMRMPEMNGHSLAISILAISDRPSIVVLTGGLEPHLAEDLLERGVDAIVAKPANFEFLISKARTLAERRRSLMFGPERLYEELGGTLPAISSETKTASRAAPAYSEQDLSPPAGPVANGCILANTSDTASHT